jgi:hypothetical protein
MSVSGGLAPVRRAAHREQHGGKHELAAVAVGCWRSMLSSGIGPRKAGSIRNALEGGRGAQLSSGACSRSAQRVETHGTTDGDIPAALTCSRHRWSRFHLDAQRALGPWRRRGVSRPPTVAVLLKGAERGMEPVGLVVKCRVSSTHAKRRHATWPEPPVACTRPWQQASQQTSDA